MRIKKYILIIMVVSIACLATGCGSKTYSAEELFKADIGYSFGELSYGMSLDDVSKKLSSKMDKAGGRKDQTSGDVFELYSCKVNLMDEEMKLVAEFKEDKLVRITLSPENKKGLQEKYLSLCEKLQKSYELSEETKIDNIETSDAVYEYGIFRRTEINPSTNTSLSIQGYVNKEGIMEKVEINLYKDQYV